MESPEQKYRNVLSYTLKELIQFLQHLDSGKISKKDEIEMHTPEQVHELRARSNLDFGWRKFGSITNNWRHE